MSYIFLILVVYSNSSNIQIQPMQSMDQCRAAIKAIAVAGQKATWSQSLPRTGFSDCIEVNK